MTYYHEALDSSAPLLPNVEPASEDPASCCQWGHSTGAF